DRLPVRPQRPVDGAKAVGVVPYPAKRRCAALPPPSPPSLEIAFLCDLTELWTVRTLSVCRVLSISRDDYRSVARTHPADDRHVIANLLNRARSRAEATARFYPGNSTMAELSLLLKNEVEPVGAARDFCNESIAFRCSSPSTPHLPLPHISLYPTSPSTPHLPLPHISLYPTSPHSACPPHSLTSTFFTYPPPSLIIPLCQPLHSHLRCCSKCPFPAAFQVPHPHLSTFCLHNPYPLYCSSPHLPAALFHPPILPQPTGTGVARERVLRGNPSPRLSFRNRLVQETLMNLCYAAKRGDMLECFRLAAGGFDVAAADYDGRTPMHLAAVTGQDKVVQFLLAHGAQVNAKDAFWRTPLQEAVAAGHWSTAEILRSNGGELHLRNQGTHLCRLASSSNSHQLARLLEFGADPNSADYDGRTALHVAAAEGHLNVVKVLLQGGASPSVRDRWQRTPMDEARDNNHTVVVATLLRAAASATPTPSPRSPTPHPSAPAAAAPAPAAGSPANTPAAPPPLPPPAAASSSHASPIPPPRALPLSPAAPPAVASAVAPSSPTAPSPPTTASPLAHSPIPSGTAALASETKARVMLPSQATERQPAANAPVLEPPAVTRYNIIANGVSRSEWRAEEQQHAQLS
ncbi:unnamed protein product, partial [Closterium sp. Naga37s-1]